MAAEAELWIRLRDEASKRLQALGGNVRRFAGHVAALGQRFQAVGRRAAAALDGILRRLTHLAKYALLAGAAFAGWQLGKGVGFNAQLEQWETGLTVLYRSSLRAQVAIRDLRRFAEVTPFQLTEIVPAARQIEAAGHPYKAWLRDLGDLAAGLTKPLGEVAEQFMRLASGVEVPETLRRWLMPRELLEQRGIRFGGQGQVLSGISEVLDAAQGIIRDRFGGMMERQSRTLLGRFSTFKDNVLSGLGELAAGLSGPLKRALESAIGLIERLTASGALKRWGESLGRGFSGLARGAMGIANRFEATAQSHGIGAALKQAWEQTEPAIIQVLGKALTLGGEAAGKAIVAAWQSSTVGKLLVGAVAARFAIPAAIAGGKGVAALAGSGALGAAGGAVAGILPAVLSTVLNPVVLIPIIAAVAAYMWQTRDNRRQLGTANRAERENVTAFWRRRGGQAGEGLVTEAYESLAAVADQHERTRLATLKVEQQITGEVSRQATVAAEIVAARRVERETLVQTLERTRDLVAADRRRVAEDVEQLRLDVATPAGRRALMAQQASRLQEEVDTGWKMRDRSAAQLGASRDALLAKARKLWEVKRDILKLDIETLRNAQEQNRTLAQRVANARPDEQSRFRVLSRLSQGVTSAGEAAEFIRRSQIGGGSPLDAVWQKPIFDRFGESLQRIYLGAGFVQPKGGEERLIASAAAEQTALLDRIGESIKQFAPALETIANLDLADALSNAKLDIRVAVDAKLADALKLELSADQPAVEQIAALIYRQYQQELIPEVKRQVEAHIVRSIRQQKQGRESGF